MIQNQRKIISFYLRLFNFTNKKNVPPNTAKKKKKKKRRTVDLSGSFPKLSELFLFFLGVSVIFTVLQIKALLSDEMSFYGNCEI